MREPQRTVVPALTAGYFVMTTASNMFAPVLATLAAAFAVSTGTVGQLGAIAPLTWAVLAPGIGPWSDRLGRRPFACGGLLLMGLGSVLASLSPNAGWLAVSRLVTGVGGAAYGPTGYALIADLFPPARRAPALGTVLAGFSAAALLGIPAVAMIAGWLTWRLAFAAVGGGLLCVSVVVWLGCPSPAPARRAPGAPPAAGLRLLLSERRAATLLLANTLHQTASAAISTYTAAFLVHRFGLALSSVGLYMGIIAAGSVAGAVGGGRMARSRPLALAGVACACTALLAPLFLSGRLPLALALSVAAANALFQSVRMPAHLSLVSDTAAENRGAVLGLNATSNQTGYTLGAVAGGALLGIAGYAWVGVVAGAASAVAAAIYGGVVAGERRHRAPPPLPLPETGAGQYVRRHGTSLPQTTSGLPSPHHPLARVPEEGLGVSGLRGESSAGGEGPTISAEAVPHLVGIEASNGNALAPAGDPGDDAQRLARHP